MPTDPAVATFAFILGRGQGHVSELQSTIVVASTNKGPFANQFIEPRTTCYLCGKKGHKATISPKLANLLIQGNRACHEDEDVDNDDGTCEYFDENDYSLR